MLLLLELCSKKEWRPAALRAIEQLAKGASDEEGRRKQAVGMCAALVPGMKRLPSRAEIRDAAQPVQPGEEQQVSDLRAAAAKPPYLYEPPVTVAGAPDRHPWDGLVGVRPSFTEFAAGVGMFAACFQAAGAEVECLIEPRESAMRLARENVPSATRCLRSVMEVDPADLVWTHGIGGGPECQPFSVAGRQLAWQDDRAYTMLRTLHVAAVMQPWWVWIENVRAIATVKEGRVWALIKAVAEMAGFVVQLDFD